MSVSALSLRQLPAAHALLGIPREEWRAFGSWLLVWVVMANVAFAAMWIVGAPPRQAEILATGVVGLLVRKAALPVKIAAFLMVLGYSLLSFVAGLFNLSIGSLFHSARFFLEIDPAQSIEYLASAALLLCLCLLSVFIIRRPQGFEDARLSMLAVLAVGSLAAVDLWFGLGMRGHYMREAAAGAPFESAARDSGFIANAAIGERHMMIVMVESLGLPVDNPEMSRLLFERYRSDAIARRFQLSEGTTTYYNSTTAAEVRELCSRWGDYYDLLERKDEGCLPALLRQKGFQTRAVHSFVSDFFDRERWYPNIGFETQSFAEDLVRNGARPCGGVFPGACDRDIPKLLAQHLKAADRPQFIYWLTVNSHLPVPPGLNLHVDDCASVSAELAVDFPMICRQFAIWDAVDAALVREIAAEDFPPTDILIVGDHMPPYFDRSNRSQFAPDRVPWLYLRWRGDASGKQVAAPQADERGEG